MPVVQVLLGALTLLVLYGFHEAFARKLSADIQARIGPERSGAHGFFQGFFDLIKLGRKQTRPSPGMSYALVIHCFLWVLYVTTQSVSLELYAFWVLCSIFSCLTFIMLHANVVNTLQGKTEPWDEMRRLSQLLMAMLGPFVQVVGLVAKFGSVSWGVLSEQEPFLPWTWTGLTDPVCALGGVLYMLQALLLFSHETLGFRSKSMDAFRVRGLSLAGRDLGFYEWLRFSLLWIYMALGVLLFWGGAQNFSLGHMAWLICRVQLLLLVLVWFQSTHVRIRNDRLQEMQLTWILPFHFLCLLIQTLRGVGLT
jgi:NADH-quinone oxidoreductase subunit H